MKDHSKEDGHYIRSLVSEMRRLQKVISQQNGGWRGMGSPGSTCHGNATGPSRYNLITVNGERPTKFSHQKLVCFTHS